MRDLTTKKQRKYEYNASNMSGADQIHLHERITRYFDDYLK